jgi:hypothetical protein
MKRRIKLANGLSATIHWLTDKPMEEVAKLVLKECCHLPVETRWFVVIKILFDPTKDPLFLVAGILSKQNRSGVDALAKRWRENLHALYETWFVVYRGKLYDPTTERLGRILFNSAKYGVPPSVSALLGSIEPNVS